MGVLHAKHLAESRKLYEGHGIRLVHALQDGVDQPFALTPEHRHERGLVRLERIHKLGPCVAEVCARLGRG